MINCNLNNKDFSLAKNIIQTQDSINQIKLMHKPNSTQEILTVVDNSGEIVVLTIDLIIIHLGVLIANILILLSDLIIKQFLFIIMKKIILLIMKI